VPCSVSSGCSCTLSGPDEGQHRRGGCNHAGRQCRVGLGAARHGRTIQRVSDTPGQGEACSEGSPGDCARSSRCAPARLTRNSTAEPRPRADSMMACPSNWPAEPTRLPTSKAGRDLSNVFMLCQCPWSRGRHRSEPKHRPWRAWTSKGVPRDGRATSSVQSRGKSCRSPPPRVADPIRCGSCRFPRISVAHQGRDITRPDDAIHRLPVW
jgi:hypothetical protein